MSIESAVNSAIASLEMEGYTVSPEQRDLLLKQLNKEITMEEYVKASMKLNGVELL